MQASSSRYIANENASYTFDLIELASTVRFFIPSTITKTEVHFEPQALDVFRLGTGRSTGGPKKIENHAPIR